MLHLPYLIELIQEVLVYDRTLGVGEAVGCNASASVSDGAIAAASARESAVRLYENLHRKRLLAFLSRRSLLDARSTESRVKVAGRLAHAARHGGWRGS